MGETNHINRVHHRQRATTSLLTLKLPREDTISTTNNNQSDQKFI